MKQSDLQVIRNVAKDYGLKDVSPSIQVCEDLIDLLWQDVQAVHHLSFKRAAYMAYLSMQGIRVKLLKESGEYPLQPAIDKLELLEVRLGDDIPK